MADVLIFAGTYEGRKLSEYLSKVGISVHACLATEYGGSLIPEWDNLTVTSKRLDADEMKEVICQNGNPLVIDATHPYAAIVTKNIKSACDDLNVEYIRMVRDSEKSEDYKCGFFPDIDEAVSFLKETKGNILVATGSKELKKYTSIEDYKKRVYARVLSTRESVEDCINIGFEGKNLICMQGPFSEELNYALLKQVDAKYLVTKESGSVGGFIEKLQAAKRAGAHLIVIGRPFEEEGLKFSQVLDKLNDKFNIKHDKIRNKKITLVGIGMGSMTNMTLEARNAFKSADLIIGAKRMTEAAKTFGKTFFISYKADEIKKYIEDNDDYENIVIALSGDSGFCSGAKKIIEVLNEYKPEILSGISTVSYFSSKLGVSWDDTCLVSMHGKEENILDKILKNKKVFSLMGGENPVRKLCIELIDYDIDVKISVGERLSYPDEKITTGSPHDLVNYEFDSLCAVFIENNNPYNPITTHGISDNEFIREKAPMTKEEVRSISLSKLRLKKDSVVYDIGAGTGSVSVEMALQAYEGKVYAIEKNLDSVALIEKNKKKFKVFNLDVINALAPEGIIDLKTPTHAFIGGSSGNMNEIIEELFKKCSNIRIVINASTLETLSEVTSLLKEFEIDDLNIVQVNVSKAKKIGNYHMMEGLNPVNIISFSGRS